MSGDRGSRSLLWPRRVAQVTLAVALLAGALIVFTQGLASPRAVRASVGEAPVAAPLIFVAIYAGLTVLLVPGALGSTVAGVLFGAVWGTALTVVGATAGATAAFLIARWLGRGQVERLAGTRVAAVDRWISERGLGAVLFLRLVPVFPFNVVNYGAGLSGLSLRTYVSGTAIGIVPGTIAFVGLGAGLEDPGSARFLGSLALLALLTVAGLIALRYTPRPQAETDARH